MLKGRNVYLKLMQREDMNIIYNICNEDEVRLYDGGYLEFPPLKDIIKSFDKIMYIDRKGLSIINEKGVIIGFITYKALENTYKVYNIGITISSRFWGRGYGKDSIETLVKYLFEEESAHRIELEVVAYNDRAINCYKACGFVEEGVKREKYFFKGKYHNTLIMGILKYEYESR